MFTAFDDRTETDMEFYNYHSFKQAVTIWPYLSQNKSDIQREKYRRPKVTVDTQTVQLSSEVY